MKPMICALPITEQVLMFVHAQPSYPLSVEFFLRVHAK